VKRRAVGKRQLDNYVYTKKIVEVSANFPLLHAYGIGFDEFRSIPEEKRGRVLDYAKYMLAFELDFEIEAAHCFLKAVGLRKNPKNRNYVKADYLAYMYQYWRQGFIVAKTGRPKWPKEMPLGVFAMAALLAYGRVRVVEKLKPNFLIAVWDERRWRLEKYLELTTKFKKPDEKRVLWDFKDDREDEEENELHSVDAVEQHKEDENG